MAHDEARRRLNLVPAPKRVQMLRGAPVRLPGRIVCEGLGAAPTARFERFWREDVLALVAQAGDGALRVRVCASGDGVLGLPEGANEGYRLRLDGGPLLEADTLQGTWAGLQTMKQLARTASPSGTLPRVEISDWARPDGALWRIFQVDLARHMAFRAAFFSRLCRELSEQKFNAIQLYFEHNFLWRAFPEVGEVDALAPEQVRDLEAEAAEWGITIIPATNLCRHMEGFLMHPRLAHLREMPATKHPVPAGQLRLSHPEAWPLAKTILDEVLATFSGPFVHLGMDEAHYIGRHPATEKKMPSVWFGEWIRRCCEYVMRRGRTPVIWGDKFLHPDWFEGKDVANCTGVCPRDITKALDSVPKDCIINDWHYTSRGDASVRFFREKGYTVWAAPSIRSGHHFLDLDQLGIMPDFVANALRAGAEGAMLTTWGWYSGFRIDDHRLSIALFADAAWRGAAVDLPDFERRFGGLRYGRPLPLVSTLKTLMGPTTKAFDRLLARRDRSGERYSRGASVRMILWNGTSPFDVVAQFGQPAYRDVLAAQKAIDRARARLTAVAGRARRNGQELADWGYYLDLWQHILDRLTVTAELLLDYRAGTAKMLPEPYRFKERRELMRRMRAGLERLYQQMLGFLRIQRRLYAEIGCPLRDLEAIQRQVRALAETMLLLRRAEETGDTPDADDLFGAAGNAAYAPYPAPIARP